MGRNNEEYYPEKVVVITGPTLGSSLKLLFFGALLGAAGTLYWMRQAEDTEEVEFGDRKEKARQLLQRTTRLAQRTKELAQAAAQNLMPQWQDAVENAKSTAAETEEQLQRDIEES